MYTEHAWKSSEGGGFVDIVVENAAPNYVFVIECKRMLEGMLLFLNPTKSRRHAKLWVTRMGSRDFDVCDWADCQVDVLTSESQYCVVGREGEKKPMLERIASELVSATEAFALEDRIRVRQKQIRLVTYVSIIVTTAQLQEVTFDAETVDLAIGKVAELRERRIVPYVRFRKQLSNRAYDWDLRYKIPIPEGDIDYAKQRTVFVVNATDFGRFLFDFELAQE